jgi:hypothetical protein
VDASTILVWLAALGGPTGVALIIRQIRIGLRDRGDRKFLRHVFDQNRDADVLTTLENLRRTELRFLKPTSGDGETSEKKSDPPLELPEPGSSA